MKRLKIHYLFIIFLALVMSSCLTTEKKEYIFKFTGKNSGTLTIRYINVMSASDDSTDRSKEDFQELLNNYVNGDLLLKEYPTATNIRKQLFELNSQLYAEVVMDFQNLEAAKLYQYDANSPFMFCLTSETDAEHYAESNGSYGGKTMPLVFWNKDLKELHLTTSVKKPDQSTKSLAAAYKEWKKK
jgi:hypothetical protein